MVPTIHCAVDRDMLFSRPPAGNDAPAAGLAAVFQLYNASADITKPYINSTKDAETQAETTGGYVSFSFEKSCFMDREWFEGFLGELPLNLFRIMGAVRFSDETQMLNYVGGKTEWLTWQKAPETRLVFIGWNIDEEEIQGKLADCITD